jgi:hypothetical protein
MPVYNIDTLAKILSKAENTDNEAESEAFMDRARQMAAVMGVELDMARSHLTSKEAQKPEERRYQVGQYGARNNAYMVQLFLKIAAVYDLRCSISASNLFVWGTGFPQDHEIVNALYQVAATKMVDDANRAIKRGVQKKARGGYGVDGRVWRAHFYEGYISTFAYKVYVEKQKAEKEYEARQKAEKEARGEFESPFIDEEVTDSVAVVLAAKRDQVEDAYKKANPHWYHPDGTPKKRIKSFESPERDDYVGDAQRAGAESARKTNLRTSKGVKEGAVGALES